ncbi:hypothetical protein HYV81_02880 [Candidatus Woesearchaeota archaeon]|nr:hypothetical protein [Candidatus Woesearchaeota archaeon]
MDLTKTLAVIATSALVLTGIGLLVSRTEGNAFLAELFFVTIFIIAAIFAWHLAVQDTPFSWLLNTFYFSLLLIFALIVYFNAPYGILVMLGTVLVGITGLAVSSVSVGEAEIPEEKETWHEIKTETIVPEQEDVINTTFKVEPYGFEKKEEKAEEEKSTLGKFVASRIGKKFHLPDCGWTQKIQNENRIWLKDKQDALEHGLEPCYCVK